MKKEGKKQQHYELPASSSLEKGIAKEYLKAYSKHMYLQDFGHFLFTDRAAPRHVTDSGDPKIDTNQYDTAFLNLYSLSLAKVEIEACTATPETAERILEKIVQTEVKDDFFIQELQKRDIWRKYVNLDSVAAWYDDKRRAAKRGFTKKGILIKTPQPAEPVPKKKRKWPYYVGVPFALTLLAGAVAQIATYVQTIEIKDETNKKIHSTTQEFRNEASRTEQKYTAMLYDFADNIDPPTDDKDKEAKRKLPIAERLGMALCAYEDKLIEKGEKRYRQVAADNATQIGADVIRRINAGELEVGQILTKYLGGSVNKKENNSKTD